MIIKLEGEEFKYEADRLMYRETVALQKALGKTIAEWQTAMSKGDAEAIGGLVWLIRQRQGDTTPFEELEFNFASLEIISDEPASPGNVDAADAAPTS